ncbi:MAG TPA: thioredoxin domain-containing protein [Rhodothermales bacterium]|nr:thioredoxin domain-containing protein [Rhodothermales bacterium]
MSNRLAHAQSPYLLQHKDNPVDWWEWSDEAFATAHEQDKPIFLSIGYSTCHWCHVMAHESFEDETVARLMNDAFINIKVDREERPDIDNIYMTVCQMLTGHGGWPLTVVMTPDKKPFFAGTYLPRQSRHGRLGMLDFIPRVAEAWQEDRDQVFTSADNITDHLVNAATQPLGGAALDQSVLQRAYTGLAHRFDLQHGGFGSAPKFPSPHNLLFLLRYWKRTDDRQALTMVETTLQAMRRGGVYDHVGYGFHRYATDAEWKLPHFEKMLYDQAMLAMAYTEAFQASDDPFYEQTAREIFTYVLRDMTAPEGGFYSAEDADSEGREGKFYVWELDELQEVLDDELADLVIRVYNVVPEGNFEDEATRRRTGENILHLKKPLVALAQELSMGEADLVRRLEEARQRLFNHRERRIHPGKDDKILVDWNGLMIAALATAARVFDDAAYAEAARRAADFILTTMQQDDNRLLHRYRQSNAAIIGTINDYAFLAQGLLELYETVFDPAYLEAAHDLMCYALDHFWDEKQGGFFFSSDQSEQLLVRSKEAYDGAIPSGNAIAMMNLLRLSRLTGATDLEQRADEVGRSFAQVVTKQPTGFTALLMALDFAVGPSLEIVIAGDPEAGDTQAMLSALRSVYVPNKVVLLRPIAEGHAAITSLAPFTEAQQALNGQATAYVCHHFVCEQPTTDIEQMLARIGANAKS